MQRPPIDEDLLRVILLGNQRESALVVGHVVAGGAQQRRERRKRSLRGGGRDRERQHERAGRQQHRIAHFTLKRKSRRPVASPAEASSRSTYGPGAERVERQFEFRVSGSCAGKLVCRQIDASRRNLLQIAIENPETTVAAVGGAPAF